MPNQHLSSVLQNGSFVVHPDHQEAGMCIIDLCVVSFFFGWGDRALVQALPRLTFLRTYLPGIIFLSSSLSCDESSISQHPKK